MGGRRLLELQDEVRHVFADATRYPLEILDPEASLEEDLGIDSVKLSEILAVLREQYRLPDGLEIPAERLRTIATISEALQEYLSTHGPSSAAAVPSAPADVGGESRIPVGSVPAGNRQPPIAAARASQPAPVASSPPGGRGTASLERTRQQVRQIFADVTRYPLEILDLEASLEEDLGIDSVKLSEILAVLREQYRLPDGLEIPAERLRTIASISEALHGYVSIRGQPLPAADPAIEEERPQPTVVSDGYLRSVAALTAERKPFRGKIAFVSGSGRGLGRDIAVYLAELGATVVVNSFHSRSHGIETAEKIIASGGDAWHLWGSMANPIHLHRIFDQIEEHYGKLDFFIANASNGMLARIEELTVEHWERALRTNVIGLHQGAVRAARMMKKNGGGKIITFSSPGADRHAEYYACIGAVKAAVQSLTKALAVEFAPYNIQVNCISAGPIDGERVRSWPDSDRIVRDWVEKMPRGRLLEHREVSHFVAYLLSEPVRAFTGSVLVLDGGLTARW